MIYYHSTREAPAHSGYTHHSGDTHDETGDGYEIHRTHGYTEDRGSSMSVTSRTEYGYGTVYSYPIGDTVTTSDTLREYTLSGWTGSSVMSLAEVESNGSYSSHGIGGIFGTVVSSSRARAHVLLGLLVPTFTTVYGLYNTTTTVRRRSTAYLASAGELSVSTFTTTAAAGISTYMPRPAAWTLTNLLSTLTNDFELGTIFPAASNNNQLFHFDNTAGLEAEEFFDTSRSNLLTGAATRVGASFVSSLSATRVQDSTLWPFAKSQITVEFQVFDQSYSNSLISTWALPTYDYSYLPTLYEGLPSIGCKLKHIESRAVLF